MPRAVRTHRRHLCFVSALALALGGCASMHQQRLGAGEVPTLIGPAVRDNVTPMDSALSCLGQQIGDRPHAVVIAVGDVRDYTGKYSVNEGNAITQGGALMVSSALGKLGRGVALAERFDPTIAERELAYADRRQLGDGQVHDVASASGVTKVPWLPYFGGTIAASDFYIVGGITELNYDVRSGGLDTSVSQVGPKARTYTQSVAIDLRIVDTKSLLVVRAISLTKQFTGYEVGFNLFRFFGSELFDINVGAKGQEPLQLGIRTALEEAVVRLVGSVARIDASACLAQSGWPERRQYGRSGDRPVPAAALSVSVKAAGFPPVNAVASANGMSGPAEVLAFDYGSAAFTSAAVGALDRIAAAASKAPVEIVLVAPDTETPDPTKRDVLIDQRLAALVAALAVRGIAAAGIEQAWRPASSDAVIRRAEPGLQSIARLRLHR